MKQIKARGAALVTNFRTQAKILQRMQDLEYRTAQDSSLVSALADCWTRRDAALLTLKVFVWWLLVVLPSGEVFVLGWNSECLMVFVVPEKRKNEKMREYHPYRGGRKNDSTRQRQRFWSDGRKGLATAKGYESEGCEKKYLASGGKRTTLRCEDNDSRNSLIPTFPER